VCFFFIQMLRKIHWMLTVKSYFSKNVLFDTPVFISTYHSTSLNCFHDLYILWIIMKLKHEGNKKLFKIDPILKHLNRKFSSLYRLEKNLYLINPWLCGRADWDSNGTFPWRLLSLEYNPSNIYWIPVKIYHLQWNHNRSD
jgi:hypothetical protein